MKDQDVDEVVLIKIFDSRADFTFGTLLSFGLPTRLVLTSVRLCAYIFQGSRGQTLYLPQREHRSAVHCVLLIYKQSSHGQKSNGDSCNLPGD